MHAHSDLPAIAASMASAAGVSLGHDTHFDAFNWTLDWWEGATHHVIDLQPWPDGRLEVRKCTTRYPWPGRFLAWCRSFIPMFPYLGRGDSRHLGDLLPSYTHAQVLALVRSELRGG
ncbi:hypothetical protein ACQQ2N_06115 [Dokdonella sp. MW10]|uniref:hypothetical protein n=1 Tax=Dokdonella sp. MW10 TaxID=2992926 RepID=UPI003F81C10F